MTGRVRQEGVRQCGQRGRGGEGRVAATGGPWGGRPLVSGEYSLGQGVGQSLGAQGRGTVEGAVCGPLGPGRVHELWVTGQGKCGQVEVGAGKEWGPVGEGHRRGSKPEGEGAGGCPSHGGWGSAQVGAPVRNRGQITPEA